MSARLSRTRGQLGTKEGGVGMQLGRDSCGARRPRGTVRSQVTDVRSQVTDVRTQVAEVRTQVTFQAETPGASVTSVRTTVT